MKRILFLINRCPLPSIDGTRERLISLIKMARTSYEVDIFLVGDEKVSSEIINDLLNISGGKIFLFSKNKVSGKINSFFSLFKSTPLQASYFYFNDACDNLLKIAPNYDVLYCHTIRFGRYINKLIATDENYTNRIVLDFNDAISLNYQTAKIKASGPWKFIYSLEEKRVKKYELYFLAKLKNFGIITKRDRDYLQKNWEANYESPVPQISLLRYNFTPQSNCKYSPENNNLVCAGNTNYPPNGQGLKLFINLVWPLIIKEKTNINLIIIGKGSEKLNNYSENIRGLGFLKQADEIISKQSLFLNPVSFGAGISTKTLWAMSLAMPIVSTPIGMAGFEDIKDGKNVIYFDYANPKKAAEIILEALNNKDKLVEIGLSANKILNTYYREDSVKEAFLNLLEKTTIGTMQ